MNSFVTSTTNYKLKSYPKQCHGVLILNKPKGRTSAGCLQDIKYPLNQKKIGHAGTLDPIAQGVLVVLLGKGTKLASFLGEGKKTYWAEICLGLESDTFDKEGKIEARHSWSHVKPEAIKTAIDSWVRLTEQDVPPYSAAKYKGKPLYALKRHGLKVPQKTKTIHIDQTEVLEINLPFVRFRVTCSQGTYIRSLAHNLGKRLQCGAILNDLIREKSYPFDLSQAYDLENILSEPDKLYQKVKELPYSLPHWDKAILEDYKAKKVKNGIWLRADEVNSISPKPEKKRAFFLTTKGAALALVESKRKGNQMYWSIIRGVWT